MNDHFAMSIQAHAVIDALDDRRFALAEKRVADLAVFFDEHIRVEEEVLERKGLVAPQGLDAGRFLREHNYLHGGLSRGDIVEHPHDLRVLIRDLMRHIEEEDAELFVRGLR